jgi:hypothetical protein
MMAREYFQGLLQKEEGEEGGWSVGHAAAAGIILKLLQQGMGRNSSSSKAFLHVIY